MSLQVDFHSSIQGDEGFSHECIDETLVQHACQLLGSLKSNKTLICKQDLMRHVVDGVYVLNNIIFIKTDDPKSASYEEIHLALCEKNDSIFLTRGEAAVVEFVLDAYDYRTKIFSDKVCVSPLVFDLLIRVMFKMLNKHIKDISYFPQFPFDASARMRIFNEKSQHPLYQHYSVEEVQKILGIRPSKETLTLQFPEQEIICSDWGLYIS